MKSDIKQTTKTSREGERGATCVMVLLISSLLLVAVAGLLMESSMNTADVTDATAEEQAYYAAESGIQSVVNVLRQNTVLPNGSLLDASKPTTDPANKIDYSKATRLSSSNITNPTAAQSAAASPPLDCKARLSRWMTYDTTYTDRVVLGDPPYSPANGFAYSVEVSDPDNVGGTISYSTPTASVKFDGVNSLSKTSPGYARGQRHGYV